MAHKFTDYSNLGGFPLSLDDLIHDRNGIYESIAAFYGDGGVAPMILSGSLTTTAWLIINKEVLPFTAPVTYPPLVAGQDYYIVVSESSSPATFEDTTVHNVLDVTRVATLVVGTVVSPPAGGVLLTSFVRWQQYMGAAAKGSWQTLSGTSTTFDHDIQYRKNVLANTLHLRGTVVVKNTVDLANVYYNLATLPIGFRPAFRAAFAAFYRYHFTSMKDSTGSDFITQLNCEVRDTGDLGIGLRRQDASVSSYTVTFNTTIPLD